MVELREHWGRNIATGKEVQFEQYRVFFNGRAVGFVGWGSGRICLTERLGPIEQAAIERVVRERMDTDVTTSVLPEVPAGFLEREEEVDDDFDA